MKEFKEGQYVFNVRYGYTQIIKISDSNRRLYRVKVLNDVVFAIDGREYVSDTHPSLFHSAKDAAEYFANIKVRKSKTMWLNCYEDGCVVSHKTKEEADSLNTTRSICRVCCKEFTYEWEE